MTRIVVGYDGSNQSHDALALGASIAGSTGAQVVLATAFPHMLPSVDRERYATSLAHESDPLVADALSRLPESVVQVGRRASGGVPAARGLRDIASNVDAVLLVVGSAHRGAMGRVLAGSVGEALLGDAPCPVAIAPRGYAEGGCQPPRIVGAAFDATHESRRAVSFAAQLARSASAALRVFGVVEAVQLGDVVYRSAVGGPDPRFSRDALEHELDAVLETLPGEVGAQKVLRSGPPANSLVDAGRGAVDLMVIGTHGYGRLLKLLLGSVAGKVVRHAPWPVVVVPPAARIEFGDPGLGVPGVHDPRHHEDSSRLSDSGR